MVRSATDGFAHHYIAHADETDRTLHLRRRSLYSSGGAGSDMAHFTLLHPSATARTGYAPTCERHIRNRGDARRWSSHRNVRRSGWRRGPSHVHCVDRVSKVRYCARRYNPSNTITVRFLICVAVWGSAVKGAVGGGVRVVRLESPPSHLCQ